MKKKLLFATYYENPDEGLSYVLDLAKALKEDLTVFLFRKKAEMTTKLDDLMSAVVFAEADEHETARQMVTETRNEANDNKDKNISLIVGKCRESGINADVQSFEADVVPSLEKYFKRKNGVDMILLSPSITDNGNITTRELQKLLNSVSRPIVTMARQ
jgi:hypothetical protein